MTDTSITVTDQTAGVEARTVARTVNAQDVHMQGMIPFRAGIMNYWTLIAQEIGNGTIGDQITLKSDRTAKPDDDTATSDKQYRVLSRRPVPSDIVGGTGSKEVLTQNTADNTPVINAIRFFLDESVQEDLNLNGSIKIRVTVGVKSDNASGTAYLQRVTVKLRQLTGSDTYTDIVSKTITATVSNATTTYVDKSVVAVLPIAAGKIDKSQDLVLEITTDGKISNASYKCYHKLYFEAGSSRCYVEIPVEEG